ncbi:MAG: hypothetical protein PHV17_09495, partial [Candidatus Omnitrophica bacterium]|nr:hypothetical protein [Candidatus Omnitrophota bacterium]
MKKYNSVFSTFHTIYRLSTTSADMKNFSIGVCRAYRNAFKADRVVMVCKNVNSYPYIKIKLEDKVQNIKKGGVSILTGREKDLFMQEREMVLGCRMIAPFNFMDTLGAIYIKRKEVFTDSERRWFSALSDEVSLALKIFCQNREEKKLMINYVKTLTRMMNQFVPTSHLHIKSIFRLIHALGKSMALSEIEIQTLEYASLLHDAGKLDIPTKLLKKQKPLTNEEFKLIMKHPRKG